MKGIIVIGHGSRSKEAQAQFMNTVDMVRRKVDHPVEGCFMELAEPGFEETVDKIVAEGATEIVVYPLFLFAGIHIKEDVPQLIEEKLTRLQGVTMKMLKPLGDREEIADLVVAGVLKNE